MEVGVGVEVNKTEVGQTRCHSRLMSMHSDPDQGASPKQESLSACRFRRNSVRLLLVVATFPDLA